MFVVWLIGLALAAAGPVLCVLALRRLADPATRRGAALALAGGLCGAASGFFFSTLVEFVAERRVDTLSDYWWAAVSAGFTLGVIAGTLLHAARRARARIEDGLDRLDGTPAEARRPVDRLPR